MCKETKQKIYDYIYKKYLIRRFFISKCGIIVAKMQMMPENDDCQNLIVFSGKRPIFASYDKTRLSKKDILEILLKESKENDIFIDNDIKILEKGTTIEQLAIEADLNT